MSFLKEREWIFLNEITSMIHQASRVRLMQKELLDMLALLIPHDSSSFYLAKKNPDITLLEKPVVRNMSERMIDDYLSYGEQLDYTMPIFRNARPIAYRETDLFENGFRKKTEFYNEFLTKDMEYPLALCIASAGTCFGAVSLFRSRKTGNFTERDLFILSQLQNHLCCRLYKDTKKNDVVRHGVNTEMDVCRKYSLTLREQDIIKLLQQGLTNSQIGADLFISEVTVKKHLQNIYKKTGASNRIQLINKCS